jgi:hypothetical protein
MIIKNSKAILSLVPDAVFSIVDNDLETVIWSDDRPMPTKEQIEQEVVRLSQEWQDSEYQRLRQPEYPPIGDQLDALWKGGEDAEEMLAKVQAVKAKYPKPE